MHEDLAVVEIITKYSEIANEIINNCETIKEANAIFKDKCINGYEVIDLIAYEQMEMILDNNKLGIIINDYWKGPFHRG